MSVTSRSVETAPAPSVGLTNAALWGVVGSQFFAAAAWSWLGMAWIAEIGGRLPRGAGLTQVSLLAAASCGGLILTILLARNLASRTAPQGAYFAGRLLEWGACLLAGWGIVQHWTPVLILAAGLGGMAAALLAASRHSLLRQLRPERRCLYGNGLSLAAPAAGVLAALAIAAGWPTWESGPRPLAAWNWLVPLLILGAAAMACCLAIHSQLESTAAEAGPRDAAAGAGGLWSTWRQAGARRQLAWWLAAAAAAAAYACLVLPGVAWESLAWPAPCAWGLVAALLGGWIVGSLALGWWSQRPELGLVPWGWLGIAAATSWLNLIPVQPAEIVSGTDQTLLSALAASFCLGLALAAVHLPLIAYGQRIDEPGMRNGLVSIATMLCLAATWGAVCSFVWWEQQPIVDRYSVLPSSYQAHALSAPDLAAWDHVQQQIPQFTGARTEPLPAGAWLAHVRSQWPADSELPPAVSAASLHTELQLRRSSGSEPHLGDYLAGSQTGSTEALRLKNAFVYSNLPSAWSYRQRLFLVAILALPMLAYAAWRLPQAMARVLFWALFRLVYRVRVNGMENIPAEGGAVLVSNHTSWIDGLTMILMSGRKIRMIAWAGNFNNPFMRFWGWFSGVILITGGPKSIQRGLAEARKALTRGELVGIFPEGGITRSGQIQGFRPGLMKLLDQMPVPIVPVYIDQLWGSIFTYAGGKTIWRLPNSFRHRLTVNLGPPLRNPRSIHEVRQAVSKLSAACVANRQGPFECCAAKLIRTCKRRKFRLKVTDSTDQALSGGALLMRSLILRRLLRRHVLAADESHVAVLIPPSSGGVLCNAALALDRRVSVNLNYTLSPRLNNECVRLAGVRHVLTSRKVLEKLNLELECQVVFLDDLKEQVTWRDKWWCALQSYLVPRSWLSRGLRLHDVPPAEPLTVIFTSGSTGVPKGVVLSQLNIASNVEAIFEAINLNANDTLIGALPFFHSFGYTVTFWGVMGLDVRGAYHFNPLEATQIAKLTRKHRGTVLLGTPTFLRSYLKRCQREDFATLSIVIAGAEKLPQELAIAFEHRFGIRPVEGYGATETAPIVSVNIPPTRSCKNFQIDLKEGTVGRTIANVAVKITDLADDTRELDVDQSGMLWVQGPNVMLGYLHRPDLTTEAIVDGWYRTGDVAEIDSDGFIRLTGRMSRFSKIGGEMIPHIQIEDALLACYERRDMEVPPLVVTAVPDPRKGERIVVLVAVWEKEPAEFCEALKERGFPNLYIPSPDSFFRIDAVPVLGSGKLDLKQIKELAVRLTQGNGKATTAPSAGDAASEAR